MSEPTSPATSAAQSLADACGAAIMRAEPVLDHYGMTLVAVGPGSARLECLRPASIGERLIAIAKEESRGQRSGVYDVRVESGAGKLIALFQGRTVTVGGPVIPP